MDLSQINPESVGIGTIMIATVASMIKLLHWFMKRFLEQQSLQTRAIVSSVEKLSASVEEMHVDTKAALDESRKATAMVVERLTRPA